MANSLAIFKRICHALPDAAQIHDLEADESEDELWQLVLMASEISPHRLDEQPFS